VKVRFLADKHDTKAIVFNKKINDFCGLLPDLQPGAKCHFAKNRREQPDLSSVLHCRIPKPVAHVFQMNVRPIFSRLPKVISLGRLVAAFKYKR
jgi:hypothetical protein